MAPLPGFSQLAGEPEGLGSIHAAVQAFSKASSAASMRMERKASAREAVDAVLRKPARTGDRSTLHGLVAFALALAVTISGGDGYRMLRSRIWLLGRRSAQKEEWQSLAKR